MEYPSTPKQRNMLKRINYVVLAALGLALLGAAVMPKSSATVAARDRCERPGQGGQPCGGKASTASRKERDIMIPIKSALVSDPTMQPTAESATAVTRAATFALG